MQRKNSILNRSGFAMIMAIVVIVIITSIMALTISLSSGAKKRVTNDFLSEQAILLAKGANEMALLAISGVDHTGVNCLNHIDMVYPDGINPIFNISVDIRYIARPSASVAPAGEFSNNCNFYTANAVGNADSLSTLESDGGVFIDIRVTTDPMLSIGEEITHVRRTIQKL